MAAETRAWEGIGYDGIRTSEENGMDFVEVVVRDLGEGQMRLSIEVPLFGAAATKARGERRARGRNKRIAFRRGYRKCYEVFLVVDDAAVMRK